MRIATGNASASEVSDVRLPEVTWFQSLKASQAADAIHLTMLLQKATLDPKG